MSVWLALALVLTVGGGLRSTRGCGWSGSAQGSGSRSPPRSGVIAAAGDEMTAVWHLGPIGGFDLWWTLVTSPEVLVFLFFMITDPRTIPETGRAAAGRTRCRSACSRRS